MREERLNVVREGILLLVKRIKTHADTDGCSEATFQGATASAIRRASMELSKALVNLRKGDCDRLPGEE